jgi:hypothetical protein
MRLNTVPARASLGSLGSLAMRAMLAIALVGTTGCDDEPTCSLLVNLSGGLSGDLAWNLAGKDQCGFADASVLGDGAEALVFVDRSGESPLQFIISVTGGLPAVGEYVGQVLFVTPDGLWQSAADACTVIVTEREHEAWSRIDFVALEGVVDCPGDLQSASGAAQDITMSTMGFRGHIHDERSSFENL